MRKYLILFSTLAAILLTAACGQTQEQADGPAPDHQSGSGFVYYVSTCGTFSWDDPVDESIYLGWRYPYVRGGETLAPQYFSLDSENVQLLKS